MISTGDTRELKLSGATVRVERVWGSGVRTCGDYWIGLEKVAFFVLPGFGPVPMEHGCAVVLVGGEKVFEKAVDGNMDEAMNLIESELRLRINQGAYGKQSLKGFQQSKYFNRGEMPVEFEMEK